MDRIGSAAGLGFLLALWSVREYQRHGWMSAVGMAALSVATSAALLLYYRRIDRRHG